MSRFVYIVSSIELPANEPLVHTSQTIELFRGHKKAMTYFIGQLLDEAVSILVSNGHRRYNRYELSKIIMLSVKNSELVHNLTLGIVMENFYAKIYESITDAPNNDARHQLVEDRLTECDRILLHHEPAKTKYYSIDKRIV